MKIRLLIILTLSTLLTSSYAAEEDLSAIKVQGNKDDKSFVKSTESISVLKPKNLNRGDVQNSVQMLNGFANVQTGNDKGGESFSIRGISDTGVTGFQKDNLASIMVDEVFQTTLAIRAGSFENWDLESVEVHRGAQSTTQGVNSLAGNILLYHNRPAFENQGDAKLTFGNYGRRDGALTFNHVLSEKFAVRFSYNKELSDGFIKNVATGNDKWGARNKDHFVSDFLYKISESEDLRLNVKILRMNRGGSYVQGNFKDYEVNENQDYKEITNNQQVGLTHQKRISETLSNKIIIGLTRGDSTAKSDEDGTKGPQQAGTRQANDKDQFLSFENQFKYKSEKVRNVLGVHLHRYFLQNHYATNLMFTQNPPYPFVVQENNKYRNTYALFESVTYDFTSHHSVNLGGRLEVVKNNFGTDVDSPFPQFNTPQEDTSTNTVLLPKLGYNYSNGNYNLGAAYNQGYRTGGVSTNRRTVTTNAYDPEKTHNFELSYKYLEKKFLVAANAFYTKWNDQQVEVIRNGDVFNAQVENVSESELYGAEVESSFQFQNADSLRFNVGYVHTQFLSFKNEGQSFTGNEFPDAANVTGQLSYWKVLNESWKLIYVSRYVSSSFSDAANTRWSPEQFYSDVNAQYNFDQYLLELYIRNVFNQKYRILNGAPRTTTTPYQASYHRVSAPAEFGARLNYFW